MSNKKNSNPKQGNARKNQPDVSHRVVSREHIGHLQKIRRKRAIAAAMFMIAVVLLLLAVTAAAILYVKDYVSAKPKFTFVTTGSVEHSVGTSVLVVRDESVFVSTTEGELIALATEGSRVAKTQKIAMVIPEGMEETILDLNNVQQQIVEIERELVLQGKGTGAVTIYAEAAAEVLPIINMVRSDSLNGDMSNLTSYSSSIQVLMDNRDIQLQEIDFQDDRLTSLRSNEDYFEQQLASNSITVKAEMPGIVSYKLDNLEGILTPEALLNLVSIECEQYIEKSQSVIVSDLTVSKDEAILRISQNEVQYFACVIEGSNTLEFPMDSLHVIRVPSEGIVIEDCKVIRSSQSEGGVFVIFQTANQVERLLDRRSVDVEIVQSKTEGLRIPISALIDPDYEMGDAQVLINSSGYATSRTVAVLDHDREYAIIGTVEGQEAIDTSTIVITNPNTIADGEKVE
jgi:hypothetical protein